MATWSALRVMAVAFGVLEVAACQCPQMGNSVESVSSSPATSIKCPTGQYLARVCDPEPDGPCGLRCVAPIGTSTP